ncbi:hypothetical protein MNBD_CHLOROFLEXI01-3702 [hydrothermal vent metagenome]|uniref:N-acetyltransferase domain-containing protein n=1 Tax=hydrothermal vent metagenome TaxID=652676 RepID=A0A3B0UUD1_9ZZZZ
MELANLLAQERGSPNTVRVATQADAGAIMRLLKTAVFSHLHADWYLPGDWLGSPGFVLLPQAKKRTEGNNLVAKLFQNEPDILACLVATADSLPVAWIRVAAFSRSNGAQQILAHMVAQTIPPLKKQGVTQLAWLTVEEWPCQWLPTLGFYRGSQIETFVKKDRDFPDCVTVPGLTFRQVYSTDTSALAALEAAAFAPMWRYSERALTIARPQSLSFDVALLDDVIVGFQLSAGAESGAHLVRITIDPEKQGLGIGSALLRYAIEGYHRRGLYTVSLNTQDDNLSSKKLYQRFGFKMAQRPLPVWMLDIGGNSGTTKTE